MILFHVSIISNSELPREVLGETKHGRECESERERKEKRSLTSEVLGNVTKGTFRFIRLLHRGRGDWEKKLKHSFQKYLSTAKSKTFS